MQAEEMLNYWYWASVGFEERSRIAEIKLMCACKKSVSSSAEALEMAGLMRLP